MLKQHNRLFLAVQVGLDGALLTGGWALARLLQESGRLGPANPPLVVRTDEGLLFSRFEFHQLPLDLLAVPHLAAVAGILLCFHLAGLYKSFRNQSRFLDLWAVLKGIVFFAVPVLLLTRMNPGWWVPWQFAAVFAGLSIACVSLVRMAERAALKHLRSRGYNQRHILVVGAGRNGQDLVHKFKKCRWMGFLTTGFVDDDPGLAGRTVMGIPVLGRIDDLPGILAGHDVDQVYCALPFREMDKALRVADHLTRSTADFRIVPDLVSLTALNANYFEIDGLPVLGVRDTPLCGFGLVAKRAFDVAFSLLALALLSPLFLAIALLVRLTSRGPVFFRQERVGWDGSRFTIFKFRTMEVGADGQDGPEWGGATAKRRTRLGGFLRRTSLDELPQFLNVLRGDMSVVGPRPERPEFIKEFAEEIPRYMLRHKTKAGMTGWAQVNGWRGDTSLKKRVQYDLYYIENWSIWFDIRIIVDTVLRGLVHRNAY